MKNILVVGMSGNLGGIEVFIKNYYLAIDNRDISFTFLVWDDKICFSDEFLKKGIKIEKLNCSRRKNPFAYYREIKEFLKTHEYFDIIHLHLQSASSIAVAVFGKRYGKKVIVHSHSSRVKGKLSTLMHNFNKYRLRHIADYFFACSEESGKWMFGERITKSGKFKVLKNAIDVKKYGYDERTRHEVRKELGISENAKVVGHVGRFVEVKNHAYLLRIFKGVLKKEPEAILMCVGKGPLEEEIKRQIKELGIEQNVLLTGVRYDLERIYQAMDVFVMPSLYEGFPISVLEAQASGLSCVLSDNITRDVGINQNVWYIALSKDIQMWADKITACLEAPRLPEDLNRTAVEYDLNKNVKELVDVYEEL